MMSNHGPDEQKKKSVLRVILPLVVVAILAAVVAELVSIQQHYRIAQNAADRVALAGAAELARDLRDPSPVKAQTVRTKMVDFAERNGLQDSDGTTGNDVNRNLVGYHLDANGGRQVTVGSSGLDGARGIEATAFVLAPTFFSHVLGLEGWPLKAAAKMYLDRVCDRESNCRARTNPSFRLPGLEE